MNFPVNTPIQLRAVLRALRKSRKLSQSQVGQLLGVNQKRMSRIERAPGLTSFDQIVRLVTALDGRLVVEADADDSADSTPLKLGKKGRPSSRAATKRAGSTL